MQKPNNVKKDIKVKYLTDHFSRTVGNLYMHLLSHIASSIMALCMMYFLDFWGNFFIPVLKFMIYEVE